MDVLISKNLWIKLDLKNHIKIIWKKNVRNKKNIKFKDMIYIIARILEIKKEKMFESQSIY